MKRNILIDDRIREKLLNRCNYCPTLEDINIIISGACPRDYIVNSHLMKTECDTCPMEDLCSSEQGTFEAWAKEWLEAYKDSLDGLLGLIG